MGTEILKIKRGHNHMARVGKLGFEGETIASKPLIEFHLYSAGYSQI